MLGGTHMAVASACAVWVLKPEPRELVIALPMAIIGGLFPDIDLQDEKRKIKLLNIPHRGITHSLPFLFLCLMVIQNFYGRDAAMYFGIGFISHIAIDLLNKKGVQILFPLSWKPCLNICNSDGMINALLAWAGELMTVIGVGMILSQKGVSIWEILFQT